MYRQTDDRVESTETPGDPAPSQQGDYTVGYGRPPKTHSYKKGRSGNPSGRPKRESVKLEAALNASLSETITVRAKGKEKRVTSLEAVLRSQMQAALRGNLNALKRVIKLAQKVGQLEDPKKIIGVLAVDDPEEEVILAEFRELKAKGDPRAEVDHSAVSHNN